MITIKKTFCFFLFACGAVLLPGIVPAAMAQTRGWGFNPCEPLDGPGEIVYDSNQGVCWLADANLAGDPAIRAMSGVAGINPNGTMDFRTAQKWVAALNGYNNGAGYLGHHNWQLPVAPLQDSTCAQTGTGDGSFGPLCTGSAMGNLYYVGLNRTYPDSVALPWFGAVVAPFHDMQLSYYWANQNNGQQEVFAFSNGIQGGVTTKYPYYYVLPMVPGPIGRAPSCLPGSGVVPYMSGPAAGKAVYDCITGYTWPANANLAAWKNFGITGTTSIVDDHGTVITAPLIERGAMLFDTAAQWIEAMEASQYLESSAWRMPETSGDLETLFTDLNLASGDARLMWTGSSGPFQHLQPFYYWGCERDQPGSSRSPCTGFAPPNGAQQMQWTFNFGDGFQGTAETTQKFFVMVYYPPPQ